jgi:predicted tellurium resistance membrane protein TerC
MYFLLAGVIDRFHYLKVGRSIVLVFVGVKMLEANIYRFPLRVAARGRSRARRFHRCVVALAAVGRGTRPLT